MSRYNFSEGGLGKYPTVILKDSLTSCSVEIALRGATVLNYFIPLQGDLFNIIDGYNTSGELEEQKGARSCIMAPFSNRIENGEYSWNGQKLKIISPIPSRREVIHGFARVMDFRILNKSTGEEKAELTLSASIKPDSFQGYPFAVDMMVKYTLMNFRLLVDIIMKNNSNENVPCGCGWHPYFKTCDNGVDHLILTIPAQRIVKVNEKLVPIEGEHAFSPVEVNPGTDFRPSMPEPERVIGTRRVNYCFTGLSADKDGFIRSSIYDPEKNLKISIFQKGGVFYAYTADEVLHRSRKAIALEPVQFITNAFNRPELTELLRVKPGDSTVFSFGIEIKK